MLSSSVTVSTDIEGLASRLIIKKKVTTSVLYVDITLRNKKLKKVRKLISTEF